MKLDEVISAEREQFGKPLAGIRVLTAEQVQAMPYATQLMAFLGAEVVKVEPPTGGESGRQSQPAIIDDDGSSAGATFLRNNFSKKSIGIDLKAEEGRELFRRLVPHFDVVAENFKPGTMEAWGLGYEALAHINPAIICVSASGFGNIGPSPYKSWPAYAPIVQAMTGICEVLRKPGEYPPISLGGAIADIAASLFAVVGTLSAVIQRQRTGKGQYVDIAMFDAMLAMADMVPFMWSMGVPHPAQQAVALVAAFKASDGFFIINVLREHQFKRMVQLLDKPEWLTDPRLSTRQGWRAHIDTVIRPVIEQWASSRTKLEAAREFSQCGLAAGPYYAPEDLPGDEHVKEHNMLIEVDKPDGDPMLFVGNPIKMSGLAEGPVRRWPKVGEHTQTTLQSLLGMSDAELASLRERGVINASASSDGIN